MVRENPGDQDDSLNLGAAVLGGKHFWFQLAVARREKPAGVKNPEIRKNLSSNCRVLSLRTTTPSELSTLLLGVQLLDNS